MYDVEGARRRIAEQMAQARARAEEQVARARELAAEVAQLEATATTADHAVTVTVRPGGVVSDLQLTHRAMRYDGASLGRLLVETIRSASAQLNDHLAAQARELTGRDDIADVLQGRLPAVPSERGQSAGA